MHGRVRVVAVVAVVHEAGGRAAGLNLEGSAEAVAVKILVVARYLAAGTGIRGERCAAKATFVHLPVEVVVEAVAELDRRLTGLVEPGGQAAAAGVEAAEELGGLFDLVGDLLGVDLGLVLRDPPVFAGVVVLVVVVARLHGERRGVQRLGIGDRLIQGLSIAVAVHVADDRAAGPKGAAVELGGEQLVREGIGLRAVPAHEQRHVPPRLHRDRAHRDRDQGPAHRAAIDHARVVDPPYRRPGDDHVARAAVFVAHAVVIVVPSIANLDLWSGLSLSELLGSPEGGVVRLEPRHLAGSEQQEQRVQRSRHGSPTGTSSYGSRAVSRKGGLLRRLLANGLASGVRAVDGARSAWGGPPGAAAATLSPSAALPPAAVPPTRHGRRGVRAAPPR